MVRRVEQQRPQTGELQSANLFGRQKLRPLELALEAQLGRLAAAPEGQRRQHVAHDALVERHNGILHGATKPLVRRRHDRGGVMRRRIEFRPRQRTFDEHLVPQVVAEQAVEEPTWAGLRPFQLFGPKEVVAADALHQRPQLPAGRQPLEDRLPEAEFAPPRQLRAAPRAPALA